MATKKGANKRATTKHPHVAKRGTAKAPARKPRPAKRSPSKPTPAPATGSGPKVRVRMYRQGLGDCFLVTFFTAGQPVHALIDCGTLGTKATNVTMRAVVADIAQQTKDSALPGQQSHLHLLISTHEHKDHVSGFGTEQTAFDAFQVDHVWQAWTEDASDALAQQTAKYKGDLLNTVALVANAMGQTDSTHPMHDTLVGLLDFVGDASTGGTGLLGAALAKTVHDAMAYVTTRAGDAVEFLSPGTVLEPNWLPGIRVYVLGPPRDPAALKNMGEHGSPDLYEFGAIARDLSDTVTFRLAAIGSREYKKTLAPPEQELFDRSLPFDPRYRVESPSSAQVASQYSLYFQADEAWRRIDHDWLDTGSNLALQLDSFTNNTSLALAFEIVASRRVLLFPADAQLGNWLSWHEINQWKTSGAAPVAGAGKLMTVEELLAATVFYKVGHHSSHNATPTSKGLEMMTSEDLVAMIPLDRVVALAKTPPWLMPADALYARLIEKTRGRVLRSDIGWPDNKLQPADMNAQEWKAARTDPRIDLQPLYIDFTFA